MTTLNNDTPETRPSLESPSPLPPQERRVSTLYPRPEPPHDPSRHTPDRHAARSRPHHPHKPAPPPPAPPPEPAPARQGAHPRPEPTHRLEYAPHTGTSPGPAVRPAPQAGQAASTPRTRPDRDHSAMNRGTDPWLPHHARPRPEAPTARPLPRPNPTDQPLPRPGPRLRGSPQPSPASGPTRPPLLVSGLTILITYREGTSRKYAPAPRQKRTRKAIFLNPQKPLGNAALPVPSRSTTALTSDRFPQDHHEWAGGDGIPRSLRMRPRRAAFLDPPRARPVTPLPKISRDHHGTRRKRRHPAAHPEQWHGAVHAEQRSCGGERPRAKSASPPSHRPLTRRSRTSPRAPRRHLPAGSPALSGTLLPSVGRQGRTIPLRTPSQPDAAR
ncbi:MAG: hypothetical protein K0R62_7746 [Nonomuraea muscovyensis]|nr:hypothetical protein [Nonomuraea muscovyensis]